MTDSFYDQPGDRTIAVIPFDVSAPGVTAPAADPSIAIIKRLSASLSAANTDYSKFDAYYNGEHGMRFASKDHKAAFGKTFSAYAENFCGLVVDAVEERLDVEGFRFPPTGPGEPGSRGADADETDRDAWRIWQDNQLDAESQVAHTEALIKGKVYVLVSPFASERIMGRSPLITVEDACEAIVEHAPTGRERTVGMKRWRDPDARRTYATLYFPDRIEKWQTRARAWANQYDRGITEYADDWERRLVPDEEWPLQHSLGVVPLVPLVNRPRLRGEGRSEIADIVSIQDAINKLATDELVTSDAASFPRLWATGTDIPIDPLTGKSVESFQAAIDRFVSTPAPDAKFGQFPVADLGGYIEAIAQKIGSVASISRTPYHYFMQHSGQPPSGESLKSSETGLVRKALRKQRHFGEGWEEVIRLAFKALDDPRGNQLDNEAVWADPESQTESQHMDALSKKRSGLKVPLKQLWADAGYSPQQIERFAAMLVAETAMLKDTLVAPVDPAGAAVQEQIQERVGA